MKKRILRLLPVAALLLSLLPIQAMAANSGDEIQVAETGVVTVSSDHAAGEGISSLQFSLTVEPVDTDAAVSFDFADTNAKIAEYRYHKDTGVLNLYLVGTEALFDGSDPLTVGTIAVQNQDGKAVTATISVKEDSLQYVYGTEVQTESNVEVSDPVVINASGEPEVPEEPDDGDADDDNTGGDSSGGNTSGGDTSEENPTYTVTVPETQIGYTLTANTEEESVKLTFTLAEGYSKTDAFAVKLNGETITLDEDGTYTISKLESNIDVTVEGIADVTPPDATITIDTNTWNTFLNKITFGLFFKETQSVTITAEDAGSGLNGIYYYLSENELTLEEVKTNINWTEYTGALNIVPDHQYVVYAKAVDNAGNTVYVNSDGVVLDATLPVISGIENNSVYSGDVTFTATDDYLDTVSVDGVEVTLSEDNSYTILADNCEHIVVVTDKAGNQIEYKITVNIKADTGDDNEPDDGDSDGDQPGDKDPDDNQPSDKDPDDDQPSDKDPDDNQPGDKNPDDDQTGDKDPDDDQTGDKDPDDNQSGDTGNSNSGNSGNSGSSKPGNTGNSNSGNSGSSKPGNSSSSSSNKSGNSSNSSSGNSGNTKTGNSSNGSSGSSGNTKSGNTANSNTSNAGSSQTGAANNTLTSDADIDNADVVDNNQTDSVDGDTSAETDLTAQSDSSAATDSESDSNDSSQSSTQDSTDANTVSTGNRALILPLVAAIVAAGIGVIVLVVSRKRTKK